MALLTSSAQLESSLQRHGSVFVSASKEDNSYFADDLKSISVGAYSIEQKWSVGPDVGIQLQIEYDASTIDLDDDRNQSLRFLKPLLPHKCGQTIGNLDDYVLTQDAIELTIRILTILHQQAHNWQLKGVPRWSWSEQDEGAEITIVVEVIVSHDNGFAAYAQFLNTLISNNLKLRLGDEEDETTVTL